MLFRILLLSFMVTFGFEASAGICNNLRSLAAKVRCLKKNTRQTVGRACKPHKYKPAKPHLSRSHQNIFKTNDHPPVVTHKPSTTPVPIIPNGGDEDDGDDGGDCTPCNDPAHVINFPTSFEPGKYVLQPEDEARLKSELDNFQALFPGDSIKEIIVHGYASRTPNVSVEYNLSLKQQSDDNNIKLANNRAKAAVNYLKQYLQNTKFSAIQPTADEGSLAGPEFNMSDYDLKSKVVSDKDLEKLFNDNSEEYIEDALIESAAELKEHNFKNLFEAKFKPFQGFVIEIKGSTPCADKQSTPTSQSSSQSTPPTSQSTRVVDDSSDDKPNTPPTEENDED